MKMKPCNPYDVLNNSCGINGECAPEHFCKQIQGQSWQTGFFELALRVINMKVRFCLKMVLKSLDLRNFTITNSFCETHAVHHLWSNLKKMQTLFLGKRV